jgi:L-rhamnose-H+ transport protein
VILTGGFLTNFVWCVFLMLRNRTAGDYARAGVPLAGNYLLCAAAGITWYLQFFFYSMGTTRMGRYDFSSWTLHMASIIIFGTLWGIALHEWNGTSAATRRLVGAGLALLVASTVIVGYGNYLAAQSPSPSAAARPAE